MTEKEFWREIEDLDLMPEVAGTERRKNDDYS
jgi:hypothetical protein